ncbi:2-(3-amino-3-carboxypropyl)histidine synthase subunit 2 [Sesamum indicum]|uniref:2-(3-amino-3-carboxypropyl)histidine synthase subunit 2 n=1 Tax=Sesamum indicum TaxID=4182 RepID=A0A6I9UAQ4_SESIN|nr:2-(3-amino-3-carboxypropyl)histidine synthase subunit 2 [Sesamum indicum]XP_020554513.1 2-(3-amino-3-carboxypropyl)histidine synthase subunit 2 [Sesamum indicum]
MDLETNYEVARVAEFISSHQFTRVALQFPDELLEDSMRVVKALRQELNSSVKLYVMADTTYGSCCVDEVGAAHVNADCVIHYGHTCLSPTSKLPAFFIFGKGSINTSNCARNLLKYGLKSGKPLLVLFGLEYAHAIPEIENLLAYLVPSVCGGISMLEHLYADVSCSVMMPCETCKRAVGNECLAEETSQHYKIGGLSWTLPRGRKMEDYLIFWIGLENPAFANVVLTFNSCEIVRYDPTEDCLMTDLSQQKKILRRRYYLVEKAKDANMIGILVGTLGAAGYLHMIHQMRELITKAGKKSYTFVMGRPNPAKLANFPECDVFVNVSCAQTALLDSKEFLAPIITPFEAMLALDRGSQWTGAYVVEFQDLIGSTPSLTREQSEEARFSFLQGTYVEDLDLSDNLEPDKDEILALVNTTEKALQVRDKDRQSVIKSVAKSGAEYFASRSYHGLDINSTNPLPGKFLTGRSGKASGYKDEKTEQ